MTVDQSRRFFVSDSDGHCYDTFRADWGNHPVRRDYRRHFQTIENVSQLKATIRAGAFAWPGGYPLYFITSDGAALSFETAKSEFAQIARSVREKANDGWRIVACDVNWEDGELTDDHTGKRIESAYAD